MNIAYQTENLRDYYSDNRRNWAQLYPSEQWVFERVFNARSGTASHRGTTVLDVGSATGGLALALSEKYTLNSYAGIDINPGVIDFAKRDKNHAGKNRSFLCGDICDADVAQFLRDETANAEGYSHVIALGCADFNVTPNKIIASCWDCVAPGGEFILSLRMTPHRGVNDISKSYQYISFSAEGASEDEEIANYAVFNFTEAMSIFGALTPSPVSLLGYGYWGAPSIAARTPHQQIVFTVLSLKKPMPNQSTSTMQTELHFPVDLYTGLKE